MTTFLWCGQPVEFETGETVAAALLRQNIRQLSSEEGGHIRNRVFCGIGSCQSCLVRHQDGAPFEACLTPVEDWMNLHPALPLEMPGHDYV